MTTAPKRRDGRVFQRPVVWVMGASRGIGKEIAKQFAFVGCEVCLSSRDASKLKTAAKEIQLLGGRAHVFQCDISKSIEIVRVYREIVKKLGPVDVLVNNAAVTVFKSFLETTLEEFDEIIDTNLHGQIVSIKTVVPAMIKKKKGWIFNILSNAAVKTFPGSAAYTATKAGMFGLGKVLREEFKKYNIKVVNILPGPVETEMWSAANRKKFSHRMMSAKGVGEAVLAIYHLPNDVVVDEIVLRPIEGDIE